MSKYSEAVSSGRMDKNAEGYADPTAGAAYNNIRREEKAPGCGGDGGNQPPHPGYETDSGTCRL